MSELDQMDREIGRLEEECRLLEGEKRALRARVAELEALCRDALDMVGHNHWDDTMQHGVGCPKCIQQREISGRIRAMLSGGQPKP